MVGLFGLLTSMRSGESLPNGNRWGTALMVLDVARFGPLEQFRAEVDAAVSHVKDTKPMEGFSEVLYPGEFEARTRQERLANGVDIPGPTWNEVLGCIHKFGLEPQTAPLPG
jgi:LDH2 family malate/lactate/ureidoglycolate dehydrogenase